MFTGLIEELGRVKSLAKGAKSVRITIEAHTVLDDVNLGDSIAVNGTCLTAVAFGTDWFTADVMPETVERTVLAKLNIGDLVNLERTLKVGDRVGGHIVSGHVDGVGTILSKTPNDNAIVVKIAAGPEVMRYIVSKGSIAIDGISLTVADVETDCFTVSLIPHSAKETTLGIKDSGDSVNLEGDILGKYVEKMLGLSAENQVNRKKSSGISTDLLLQNGFM